MSADHAHDWLRARRLASRLKQESFAASKLTAAESFGAACGLMGLASPFRAADGPDVVRERDERASRDAWEQLHVRCPIGRR